jgi:hypothetical protein
MDCAPFEPSGRSDLELIAHYKGSPELIPQEVRDAHPHIHELVSLVDKPPFLVRNIKVKGRSVLTWMRLIFMTSVERTHQSQPEYFPPPTIKTPRMDCPAYPAPTHPHITESCMQHLKKLQLDHVMVSFYNRPTDTIIHLTFESERHIDDMAMCTLEAYGQNLFRTESQGMVHVYHKRDNKFLATACTMALSSAGPVHLICVRPTNNRAYVILPLTFD